LVGRVSKQVFPCLDGCSGKHVYVAKAVSAFLSCAVKLLKKKEERHGEGGKEMEGRKILIFLVHITRLLAKHITNILRRNRVLSKLQR
jgi:hypothetical protein